MGREDIRLECLKLAAELPCRQPEEVLKNALLFYSFIVEGVKFKSENGQEAN